MCSNSSGRSLKRNDIVTLSALLKHSPADLLAMKGIGEKALAEVQAVLEARGLTLRRAS